ncbi:MAG: coenzyme F420-0:L-glutamate ligase [Candidatus Bathyarchaeia archaeon]|jgi:coenzyme F420-0:L-glutamate ligase/coenzyme F420-1:gamma-L-glutamate ligase
MDAVKIIAVKNLPLITEGDNIAELIFNAAIAQNTPIRDRDIIVITHVAVSKAEGDIVNLDDVLPSERAIEIAQKTGKDPALVETILRETKEIVRLGPNSIITEIKNGMVCANAGVDKSNVEGERTVALLPKNPDATAQKIRQEIKRLTGFDVAVIISDTHGRPFRMGEVNVAVGVAGIKPLRDRRGEKDLFGYVLKVKRTAVADELASAAELVMGQADEGIPAAIIRGYKYQPVEDASATELVRPKEKDLFR